VWPGFERQELMLSGKPVRAEKALRLGLIDRLVPEAELRGAAREMLLTAPAPHRPPWPQRLLSSPRAAAGEAFADA